MPPPVAAAKAVVGAARAGSASRNERLVGLLLSVPSAWLRGGVGTKSAEHGSARASKETRIPSMRAELADNGFVIVSVIPAAQPPTSACVARWKCLCPSAVLASSYCAVEWHAHGVVGFALTLTSAAEISRPALVARWSATDGFSDASFCSFDAARYQGMVDDEERTTLFAEAIRDALRRRPGAVVLDIGTGPQALLALIAGRAGAKKVYAVEVQPEVAALVRQAMANAVEAGDVPAGLIELHEGFSTVLELPEQVDLLVAEIVGSVASGEGIRDDARRAAAADAAALRGGVVHPPGGRDLVRADELRPASPAARAARLRLGGSAAGDRCARGEG